MNKARLLLGAPLVLVALASACSDSESSSASDLDDASRDAAVVDSASSSNDTDSAANKATSDATVSPDSGINTCGATGGCYQQRVSQAGSGAGCKGTFETYGHLNEAADALAEYRNNPACLLDDKQDAGACTTRMLCTEGDLHTVVVLTVGDDGNMNLSVDLLGGSGNCHIDAAFTRVDDSSCADAGGGNK